MAEQGRAHLALLVVQIIFGVWPVAAQVAFRHLDPLALASVRTIGAAVFLLAIHRLLVRNPVPAKAWPAMLAFSLLGVVLNQSLFVLGLERTSAVNATLLITTIPVFTYALAVATGRETMGPRRALGIGLALAGAVYLVGLSGYEASWHTAAGDLMVLANALFFSAFLVWGRPAMQRHDPLSVTTWMFAIGAVLLLPVGLAVGAAGQLAAAPASLWWVLAFIILGPSVLTYVLNATALRSVPSSTVAVYIYLQPVVAAITAAIVLNEAVEVRVLPAAALIFAGVWLVARRRPRVLRGRAATA